MSDLLPTGVNLAMAPNLDAFLDTPLTLGELQTIGPLTIAPLFGAPAPMRLLSLEEAIRHGAEARELPDARVDHILVRNPTEHALLLLDGEEILGARQNRVIDGTVLVPAHAEHHVQVCCVEENRWDRHQHDEAFTASAHLTSTTLRRVMNRTARRTGRGDQHALWRQIAHTVTQTGTHTPTRAMTAVFDRRRARLDELTSSVRCAEGQLGMIVGVGSRVWGIDLVADPITFASMQRRLLRGYAVDAARVRDPAALSRAELELVLRRLLARPLDRSPRSTAHRFGGVGLPIEGTATIYVGRLLALGAILPGAPQAAADGRRVRTSDTDPIDVAWLASPRGHVGITFAPGKRGPSLSGPRWSRDLQLDLLRLREHHRVDTIVCLLSDRELEHLGIHGYEARVAELNIALHRLPLRDGHAPETAAEVRDLLARVLPHLDRGERVVIHCAGGLGRAGTIAGCTLIELGISPDRALDALRARHPRKCPESRAQRDFVRGYPRTLSLTE